MLQEMSVQRYIRFADELLHVPRPPHEEVSDVGGHRSGIDALGGYFSISDVVLAALQATVASLPPRLRHKAKDAAHRQLHSRAQQQRYGQ